MLSNLNIDDLPLPATLAVPLAADAQLQVRRGETLPAGAVLATGTHSADCIAPRAGTVSDFRRQPLANGNDALCVILQDLDDTPTPRLLPPLSATTLPQLLKRAGIVGLGGGAFPAWRKWRQQLRYFIANGLETETAAYNDAALIAAAGDNLIARVRTVAQAFAATPLLALPEDVTRVPRTNDDPMLRYLPAHYSLGNERILVQHLCQLDTPAMAVAADYGVVCFNIATVLAMAAAIDERIPLSDRVITVHDVDGGIHLLRVPLGTLLAEVRHYLKQNATALIGGADEQQIAGDDAVITAATTVIHWRADAPPRAAQACIRCGACEPVCPAALAPQELYWLAQDSRLPEMQAQRLTACLECRRCDEVCPSNIGLTALFIQHKKQLAANAAEAQLIHRRQQRFDHHEQRLAQPVARFSAQALKQRVAAMTKQVSKKQ